MPKPLDEDRARRREQLEQKRAARRAAKQRQEEADAAKNKKQNEADEDAGGTTKEGGDSSARRTPPGGAATESSGAGSTGDASSSPLVELPDVAMQVIFCHLPAADLGRLTMTCKSINLQLPDARVPFLVARLGGDSTSSGESNLRLISSNNNIRLCRDEADAELILRQSFGGGNTGRILPRGKFAKKGCNEFVSYARFLEEAANGYGALSTGNRRDPILLPKFVEGRFASASPEHSLCRVGGDGKLSGAGGSGVASWGVGRRGQLGHGKRQDQRVPRMLMGGIGYGVRVVQVAAGGGLVRVAHSLFLTSTGRVLSFGTGQYGALGHGYSAAKQLPDVLRPQYIDALSGVRCICVAAGELHSAAVTSDGDLYTWGDGFCGECNTKSIVGMEGDFGFLHRTQY